MTEPKQHEAIVELARALSKNPRDREALSLAARWIADGGGRALFDALLDVQRNQVVDEPAAVSGMMSLLEAMMSASVSVAGYLMARLYPIAGQRRSHATYNAIELWMSESTDVELADVLMQLANEGVRPKLRTRYEGWATNVRERQRRR